MPASCSNDALLALLAGADSAPLVRFYLDMVNPTTVKVALSDDIVGADDVLAYLDAGQLTKARIAARSITDDNQARAIIARIGRRDGAGAVLADVAGRGSLPVALLVADSGQLSEAGAAKLAKRIARAAKADPDSDGTIDGVEQPLALQRLAVGLLRAAWHPDSRPEVRDAAVSFAAEQTPQALDRYLQQSGTFIGWDIQGRPYEAQSFPAAAITRLGATLAERVVKDHLNPLKGVPEQLIGALLAQRRRGISPDKLPLRWLFDACNVHGPTFSEIAGHTFAGLSYEQILPKLRTRLNRMRFDTRADTIAAVADYALMVMARSDPVRVLSSAVGIGNTPIEDMALTLAGQAHLQAHHIEALLQLTVTHRACFSATVVGRLYAHRACPPKRYEEALKARHDRGDLVRSPAYGTARQRSYLARRPSVAGRAAIAAVADDADVLAACIASGEPAAIKAAVNNPAVPVEAIGAAPANPTLFAYRRPLARFYHHRLGDNLRLWQLAATLMLSFEGTAAELVDAAEALNDCEA